MEYIRIIEVKGDELGPEGEIPRGINSKQASEDEDAYDLDKKSSLLKKYYWFLRNCVIQRRIFFKIDKYRRALGIEVFVGVFSGILPLVFYFKKKNRNTSVIFSDMDSWFSEVHTDMKKLWYRKYYSFNYALGHSDCVDFLSPFILDGVKKRGLKLSESAISVAPCSFTDYSACIPGKKKNIEIAFCARLEAGKNPFMYLEAAKEILKTRKDVIFHILGEGVLFDEIQSFIIGNNLTKNIDLRFHRNPPEVFAKTSIFVSIQTNTNYPSQSLLEAMACSNAVIASDVGDTRLLVNEKNGFLIPFGEKELTKQMLKLIEDKELTQRMGEMARASVINVHTIEKYTDYFLGVLNKSIYRRESR